MIGYHSYQDPHLTPPDYWADTPDRDSIAAELVEKYRDQAIAAMQAASDDPFGEAEITEWALEIAAQNGDSVEMQMMRHAAAPYL